MISLLGCTKSHHKEDFIGQWEGRSLTIYYPHNPSLNVKSKIKLSLYDNDSFLLTSSKIQCRQPDFGKFEVVSNQLRLKKYSRFEDANYTDTFNILSQKNDSLVLNINTIGIETSLWLKKATE